jgi:adenine deaminase
MRATFLGAYSRQLALTKLLDETGVRMMSGTDGGGQVPGQSLHQEFDELAKAGLSSLKILQMTTLNPAEYLGRSATMGTIDVGKDADMVILDASPIESVQNMQRIFGVIRAGFYYSSADLNSLKAHIEAGHGEFRWAAKLRKQMRDRSCKVRPVSGNRKPPPGYKTETVGSRISGIRAPVAFGNGNIFCRMNPGEEPE